MVLFLPALLAAIMAGAKIAGGAAAAGAVKGGGLLAKAAAAGGPALMGSGKAALGLLGKGTPSMPLPGGLGSGGMTAGASKLLGGGAGGGNPLQGLFDMLGGTGVESTGKIGEIAQAQKVASLGPLGKLRSFGAQRLQSGLGDAAKNALSGGLGGGGGKQAGGINFPSVPSPAQPIQLPPLPEYNMPSTEDISGLRAQLLQEILAQGGGGGGF